MRSKAKFDQTRYPVTFIVSRLEELQFTSERILPVELVERIGDEDVGDVAAFFVAVGRAPLLAGVQEGSLERLVPMAFGIDVCVAPGHTLATVVTLAWRYGPGTGEVGVEYPVFAAAFPALECVEYVSLRCAFSGNVNLVRVEVRQHIVVLACQGRQVVQCVAGAASVQGQHRAHMVDYPETRRCAEGLAGVDRLCQNRGPRVRLLRGRYPEVLAFGGEFSLERQSLPAEVRRGGVEVEVQ